MSGAKQQVSHKSQYLYPVYTRITAVVPKYFALLPQQKRTAVAQLVEALRYKSEGRRFDSRCCHWNFSLT